jgi:cobalt/nickel transport protein
METKNIIMLLIAMIIVIIPLFLYSGLGEDQGYFVGADDSAEKAVAETGYQPWFEPIWEPPSGEIENLLFALQAAIGAFILGYFLGYYRNKEKNNQKDDKDP